MTEVVLTARALRRSVRLPGAEPLHILRGVDLEVAAGDSVAIEGRSGSGKTTLLAALGLLTTIDSGEIWVKGRRADHLSDAARARLRNDHIGFVFQSYSLIRQLSAQSNVALPLYYGRSWRRDGGQPRLRPAQRARELLKLVGLEGRERSRPRHLSGGEQQRVAIARALVRRPSVILADEPTGALDVATASSVMQVLLDATREEGVALIVVTHDPAIAKRMGRRLLLHEGVLHDMPAATRTTSAGGPSAT
jgi:ABC-type antimicrobial peptide transport system, ATPase component